MLIVIIFIFLIPLGIIAVRALTSHRPAINIEPSCGQCGYCVRGITSLTCPECGSDLREVGIIAPRTSPRRSPATHAILWMLAMPLPALLISVFLMATVLPFTQVAKVHRVIFLQAPYLNATIEVFGSQRISQPPLLTSGATSPDEVDLSRSGGHLLHVNLVTGAYKYQSSKGQPIQQPGGFNGTILADWLSSNGIDPTDQRVLELCDSAAGAVTEIPQMLNNSRFTPFNDRSGRQIGIAHPALGFIVHDEPSPWLIALLALFWIGIWLYGLKRIRRRPAKAN